MDGDTATVGISDFAQNAVGEVVYVEAPEEGADFEQGDVCASVESVKAVSSVYAPVGGTVTAINEDLENDASLVNSGAETEGWMFKVLDCCLPVPPVVAVLGLRPRLCPCAWAFLVFLALHVLFC